MLFAAKGDLLCGNCGLVLGDKVVDTRSECRSFPTIAIRFLLGHIADLPLASSVTLPTVAPRFLLLLFIHSRWIFRLCCLHTGRTFADSDGDDPSRVGAAGDPLLSSANQLSSVISFRDNHSGVSRSLQRAAATVSSKSGEKTLIEAFSAIQDMCDQISLPRLVSDSAKQLFKRQEEEKLLKGKQQPAIVAACIFIACRDARVERSFKEIVALSGVPKKQIAQCFSRMSQTFGVSAANIQDSSSAGLTARFCNHLGLPPAVQSATAEVVRKIDQFGSLAGRSPLSIASACVYFTSQAFGMAKSVKEICQVAGISDSTLRTSYKWVNTADTIRSSHLRIEFHHLIAWC